MPRPAEESGVLAPALQPSARAIGWVYLAYFVVALLPLVLGRGIVTPGNAAATAAGILAHEPAWRVTIALSLVGNLIYIALAALFYRLFAPVNRNISLLGASLALAGATVQIVALLLQLAPLVILKDPLLPAAQGQAEALLSLRLYSASFSLSFVIFGLFDLAIGFLIYRSTFLPRAIGVLMMLAGAGWLTFLWSSLATPLMAIVYPMGAIAELVFMAWLITKGVDLQRWQEAAARGLVSR